MTNKHWKIIKITAFALVFIISVGFGIFVTFVNKTDKSLSEIENMQKTKRIENIQKVVIFSDLTLLIIYAFARSKS